MTLRQRQQPQWRCLAYSGLGTVAMVALAIGAIVPLPVVADDTCKFEAGSHTYNLNPLQQSSSYYEVNNERLKVEVDVTLCQGLSVQGCKGAVMCVRDLDGTHPRPAGDPSQGSFSLVDPTDADFGARLKYRPRQKGQKGVHFVFTCGVGIGEPVLVEEFDQGSGSEDYAYYVVQWATDEMCDEPPPSHEVNCQATDTATDNEYDLSPLIRSKQNWVAVDVLENNKYRYEINVCSPVVVTSDLEGTPCEKVEGTAACKSKVDKDGTYADSMSLGWSSKPIFRAGKLRIETSFGTKCDAGYQSDAIIDFICDVNAGSGHPVLREVTDQCVYIFNWRSAVACPVQDEIGKKCRVADKATGTQYDLTDLNRNKDPYSFETGNYTYYFNVCGDIGGVHDCAGYGACQVNKDTGHAINLGASSLTLEYSRETLELEYAGGDSCGSSKRKTVFTFKCIDGDDKYRLVESSTCVYEIEFFTSAACGLERDLLECVVTDKHTGEEFDLSSLTRTGSSNWRMSKDAHTQEEIELNVCAPLVYSQSTASCPANAAVCGIRGDPRAHLGLPAEPTVQDGVVTLHFPAEDGKCGSTTILLHCSDTQEAPRHMSTSQDGCSVTMQWDTPAACAVNAESGENCMVTDPTTETTYDLRSLSGTTRKVGGEGDEKFYISLCSTLDTNVECRGTDHNAACIHSPRESHSIGQTNSVLHVVDGTLYAKYPLGLSCDSAEGLSTTVVTFECDPNLDGTEDHALSFSDHEHDTCHFEFTWRTRLACSTPAVECIAEDPKGNVYDLSQLSKTESNWFATGTDNSFYEINVCRPINDNVGTSCLRTRDAACQRTPSGSYSLGTPSAPKWDADRGVVYVEYTGGAKCNGKERRARINFICDKDERPGSVVFDGETSLCEYDFTWATEAACPIVSKSELGCAVVDESTDTLYNLTRLIHPKGYSIEGSIGGTDYTFLINVCEPLDMVDECADDPASVACQKTGSREYSLGSLSKTLFQSPTIDPSTGQLVLEYSGGTKCDSSGNIRRSRIVFECDTHIDIGAPEFVDETSSCQYDFKWRTRYACPLTEQSAACKLDSIDDNGDLVKYDLAPLIRTRRNWYADVSASHLRDSFQINVCRPLVASNHGCAPNSGVCRITDYGVPDVSYGHAGVPTLSPVGKLQLSYQDGAPCGNDTDLSHSVVIDMVCPRHKSDGAPIPGVIDSPLFVGTGDSCVTQFEWETTYACPVSNFKGTECHITDVLTGQYFDLSSLKSSKDYRVTRPDGKPIKFNICKAASSCTGDGLGACAGGTSYGDANAELSFDEGALSLTYTGGDKCNGKTPRSTRLEMVCDPDVIGRPTVELGDAGDDTCETVIFVNTNLACHEGEEVECIARDPDSNVQYDLSPLRKIAGNYYAGDPRENAKYTYVINVCRTLVPEREFPDCDIHSGVCQISRTNDKFLERNLGDVASPQVKDGKLFIEYADGDKCGNVPRRTRIYFLCGETTGEPIFVQERNCYYIFNWRTNAACGSGQSGDMDSSKCQVSNAVTSSYYDLRPLKSSNPAMVKKAPEDENLQLSVCGSLQCGAQQAGACKDGKVSLGKASEEPLVAGEAVHLHYGGGDACDEEGNHYSSEIIFVCDYSADASDPQLFYQDRTSNCHYIFKWYTRDACKEENSISCVVRDFSTLETYDLSPLTRLPGEENWKALDTRQKDTYEYEINVCHNLIRPVANDPDDKCRGSAVCQTKPGSSNFPNYPLGRLDSPPTLVRGQLQLTYTMDDLPPDNCNGNRRRASITFSCLSGTLGKPVFDNEDETCHYFFVWETSAACSTHRTVGSQCKVKDPVSLLTFDLRRWADNASVASVPLENNMGTLLLAACGAVDDCNGAGACIQQPDGSLVSAGNASSALTFSENGLWLTYSNGDECPTDPKRSMSTIISFACPEDLKNNSTSFRFYDCSFYYTWPTDRACRRRRQATCVVSDPETGLAYDLSPLEKSAESQSNWVVDVQEEGHDFEYILNVCHSLNDQVPSTGCDDTAGVCQISGNNRFNLGGVTSPKIKNGSLVLEYVNGESTHCPGNKARRTVVHMVCDEDAGLGKPEFVEESDELCQYVFRWVTSAACPVQGATVGDHCAVQDPVSGNTIDLAGLNDEAITGTDSRATYHMSLCEPLGDSCDEDDHSGLCMRMPGKDEVSLGRANGNLMTRDGLVYLVYHNGSQCPFSQQTQYSAEIRFVCRQCEPDELVPESTQGSCRTLFTYYTGSSALCPPGANCTSAQGGSSGSSNAGAIAAGVLIPVVLIGAGVAFYFLYWRRRRSGNMGFMPMSMSSSNFEEQDNDDFEDAEDDDPLEM